MKQDFTEVCVLWLVKDTILLQLCNNNIKLSASFLTYYSVTSCWIHILCTQFSFTSRPSDKRETRNIRKLQNQWYLINSKQSC